MTTGSLLKHFDRIAEAPDAIPHLRRFILDLAVRGKLVEQDPNDESAAELLKRIETEKAGLTQMGLYRQQDTPSSNTEEVPYDIPTGWQWTQMAKIGVVNPRCKADDTADVSFIPMSLITAEYGNPSGHEIRPWIEIKKGFTHFAEGDVGLAKITPCFENGKSTVFRNLTGGLGAGTTELHVLRPIHVSPDYVLIFLKSPHFIGGGIPKMTGTAGQKRVPKEYFSYSPFPLPPLAEQHRIVAKVDELMALCGELEVAQTKRERRRDRLVAATLHGLNNGEASPEPGSHPSFEESARFYFNHLPRLTTRPEHIQQLRQTILNLAVRGKLIPQDPNDEPVSQVIADVQNEMKHQIIDLIPSVDETSVPFKLPPGWAWESFSRLGIFGRGRSKHRPRNDPLLFEGGTHRFIQTGDVARSNGVIKSFTSRYNEAGLEQSKKWPKGTLCITIAANIADSGILEFDACFPDSVVGFIPASPFPNARYFEYFIRTVKSRLLDFAPATAQKNINLGILNELLIPLPPLTELKRIVEKVDELMSICDELEVGLEAKSEIRGQFLEATLLETLQ